VETVEVTVFRVDVSVPGTSEESEENPGKGIELNWDDDNSNNKSDRRDSGVPDDSAKVVYQDPDLLAITLSTSPSLDTGISTLYLEQQNTRAAVWESADRSGNQIESGWTISNSSLPKTIYFEGIYPNTLSSAGVISGEVRLRMMCTMARHSQHKDLFECQQYLLHCPLRRRV
jgi:hypothetical protein